MDLKVQYDSGGRIKFHPLLHDKQGEKWTEEDVEYMCKYADIDNLETLALALGRTKATVSSKLGRLRKNGKFEYYRNLNKHW